MTRRIRTSEIGIFVAFILFMLPWLAIQNVRDPLPIWQDAVRVHPEIGMLLAMLNVAGLVALLGVCVMGFPVLYVIVKQAAARGQRDIPLLLLVPVAALALLVGYTVVVHGSLGSPGLARDKPFQPLALAAQLGLTVLMLFGLSASVTAVALAVKRGDPSDHVVRLALIPATIATLAIGVGVLA